MQATTLRLIFPQWQGGESSNIAGYVPELAPQDAAQGYVIGARLLAWLAPTASCPTATVPVSLDAADTATENGVFAYAAVKRQLQAALDIIAVHRPERIVTLGGECSVSVAPFSFLAAQYPGDLAVLWFDAHPDLRVPHEDYTGFHAMSLAALLGRGDDGIVATLPAVLAPEKTLLVGLRSPEAGDMWRPAAFGVSWIPSASVNEGDADILTWIRESGARNVAVHLDLDSLDPRDLVMAVARDADGLRLEATVQVINAIAREFDLVGLSITEPMPREVIKLRGLLQALPLLSRTV